MDLLLEGGPALTVLLGELTVWWEPENSLCNKLQRTRGRVLGSKGLCSMLGDEALGGVGLRDGLSDWMPVRKAERRLPP